MIQIFDRIAHYWNPGKGIIALGILLSIFPIWHKLDHSGTIPSTLFGVTFPLLLSYSLIYIGYRLTKLDLDTEYKFQVFVWCLAGIFGMGLLAIFIIYYQYFEGFLIEEPVFVITNTATGGGVAGVLIGIYDARNRKRTDQLEESEKKLNAIFEGTLDALVIADDDGNYIDANPAASKLFGVSREELLERSIGDFAEPSFGFGDAWIDFQEAETERGEFTLLRPDREKRIVEYAASANVFPGWHLSALRDITERKHWAEELREEREKTEFLNQILRHNILNDMNIVIAKAELLQEKVNEGARSELRTIASRSENVADLIQTVRRLTNTLDANESLQQRDLSYVLKEEVEKARETYDNASINLTSSLPGQVTVAATEMLNELFENLLNNAIQHNDKPNPDIEISVNTAGQHVLVKIADNGPGIPDSRKEDIFGKGEKGVKSTGTGFGLYIVNMLTEQYDGEVWLEDNEPEGTVVNIKLPKERHETDTGKELPRSESTA